MRLFEILAEEVGGNYLYHSVEDKATLQAILNSGYFKAGNSAQTATNAQTDLPTVSFGRNLQYQLSGEGVGRDYKAVFVLDRNRLESRYKTIGTSQSNVTKGLKNKNKSEERRADLAKNYDYDKDGALTRKDGDAIMKAFQDHADDPTFKIGMLGWMGDASVKDGPAPGRRMPTRQEISNIISPAASYFKSKAGHEYEEVVPTKNGKVDWKGSLVGFYLVPKKGLDKDPELLASPWRLDMPSPNVFKKANPQQQPQQVQQPQQPQPQQQVARA
jgi:hypothetical protein